MESAGIGSQRIVLKADECRFERHLASHGGRERKPSERVGQATVNRTYYKYIGTSESLASVIDNARDSGLCSQISDSHQSKNDMCDSMFHAAKIRQETDTSKYR